MSQSRRPGGDRSKFDVGGFGHETRPSEWAIFKVLVRKNLLVSWKRRRLHATVAGCLWNLAWLAIVYVIVATLLWHNEVLAALIYRGATPIFLSYGTSSIMTALINEMVTEKEGKMKIVQLVNGVAPWLYWVGYLSYYAIVAGGLSVLWTAGLCATTMRGCNPLLVCSGVGLTFLQGFGASAIFATVFDEQKTVQNFTQIPVWLGYIPIGLSYLPSDSFPHWVRYATGFLPMFAPVWWSQSVITMSVVGESWTWGENFDRDITDDLPEGLESYAVPPAGSLLLLFLVQVSLTLLFAYWFDQVWQGEFGSARPLTFCLRRAYLCPEKVASARDAEAHPLEIRELTKVFPKRGPEEQDHRAVDDLSFHVCSGEIFALLGHNGAGKTTAMNCISGVTPATSGDALVMGYSVKVASVQCRWNLSVCPQDNPLYEDIAVVQHLRFFAALRGCADPEAEISESLEALGLVEKREAACKDLSGGQKRRLWVATALMGRSPVVFLDEPTSGMDPASRRQLWQLLVDMRGRGRAILFTTHYLDEADILADRKAVLAKGRVQAMGTSMELKREFGVGYKLRIVMRGGARDEEMIKLRELVLQGVPGSNVHGTTVWGRPLAFDLPYSTIGSIGPMLVNVDRSMNELMVDSYDISLTSLEEIFMKLGRLAEGRESSSDSLSGTDPRGGSDPEAALDQEVPAVTPAQPWTRPEVNFRSTVLALLELRMRQLKRRKLMAFWTLGFPVGFLLYMLLSASGWVPGGPAWGHAAGGGFSFAPGLSLLVASSELVVTIVGEKETKSQFTMIAQGMHPLAYYLGTLPPLLFRTLAVSCMVPVLSWLTEQDFMREGGWLFVWVGALLQPVPIFLALLNFARKFDNVERAMKVWPILILVCSTTALGPLVLWRIGGELETWATWATVVHTVMSFVNPAYLQSGLILALWRAGGGVTVNVSPEECCGRSCDCPAPASFGFSHWLGQRIVWAPFVGQAFLCGALAVMLQAERVTARKPAVAADDTRQDTAKTAADLDVRAEESRALATEASKAACLYKGLHHTYAGARRQEPVRAVRGISLCVDRGECFGLLGPNGAGKTTTLSCLTGEILPPTAGEVFVAGHAVTGGKAARLQAYQHLGFCPQVDPILPSLTGREHLEFYGWLKGIPRESLRGEVERLLELLMFEAPDWDVVAQKYSGGMKRKLSLGVALIGSSDVIFLDEPSAAVDASAKRYLWKVIREARERHTMVMTTHSMEEAESVCDRLAIQVKGVLRCVGTPSQLKVKYALGYQLELFLSPSPGGPPKADWGAVPKEDEREAQLARFVEERLVGRRCAAQRYGFRLVFQLPPIGQCLACLGEIFTEVLAAKDQFGIEDFSISQPTLEQVFLRFAGDQDVAEEGSEDDDRSSGGRPGQDPSPSSPSRWRDRLDQQRYRPEMGQVFEGLDSVAEEGLEGARGLAHAPAGRREGAGAGGARGASTGLGMPHMLTRR